MPQTVATAPDAAAISPCSTGSAFQSTAVTRTSAGGIGTMDTGDCGLSACRLREDANVNTTIATITPIVTMPTATTCLAGFILISLPSH